MGGTTFLNVRSNASALSPPPPRLRLRETDDADTSVHYVEPMQKKHSWDKRVKAFFEARWRASPRVFAYYAGLWDGHLAANLVNEHFVSELTGGLTHKFHQRVWEMLLARHLTACGHKVSSGEGGAPDFRFENNGTVVWVEAISPQPGPDLPPEWVTHDPARLDATVGTVPHQEILLRWTTAFDAKSKKGTDYRGKNVVGPEEAYVIAIDGCQLGKIPLAHGISRLPYVVEATFAMGPLAFVYDSDTGRFKGTSQTVRPVTENRNKAPVRTEPFFNPAYSGVSAVIGCAAPMFSDAILPIQVAYNPLAKVSLAPGLFGRAAEEWTAEPAGAYNEAQEWDLKRADFARLQTEGGIMKGANDEAKQSKEIYAVVGELVLIATALDTLLNSVIVEVLHLGSSPMIEPVVATLDPVRKIEILKERAPFIRNGDWKKRVTGFVSKAEIVFRRRNIACHMSAVLEDGKWTLTPVSAAKLLKHLDLEKPKAKRFSFDDLKAAISTGEAAMAEGLAVVENFKRANAALAKKQAQSAKS